MGTTPSPSQKSVWGWKVVGKGLKHTEDKHTSHYDEVILSPFSGVSTPKIQVWILSPNFEEIGKEETQRRIGVGIGVQTGGIDVRFPQF